MKAKLIRKSGLLALVGAGLFSWNRSYLADGKPHYFPRSVANDTELRPLADKTVQINDPWHRTLAILSMPI